MKLHRLMALTLAFLLMVHQDETGALKVKDISKSTDKWAENAGRSAEAYATEAEAAATAWASKTAAAAGNYNQAITAPGIKERFRRGVIRAGAEKFARKIRDVGRDRFSPGITAAVTDYKAGAEPYFSTLAALTLSARKPKGDPANYNRVMEVGKALNAKRLALLGAGGSGG
ncbi:hypothetical protein LCGC14_0758420 [marine sediment metagenome]|uniref:Uncharacterized protein n=1 Tax=marine sediment metagenome TaxID=412755 RepID=A0A0F9Q210_9ZZZZ